MKTITPTLLTLAIILMMVMPASAYPVSINMDIDNLTQDDFLLIDKIYKDLRGLQNTTISINGIDMTRWEFYLHYCSVREDQWVNTPWMSPGSKKVKSIPTPDPIPDPILDPVLPPIDDEDPSDDNDDDDDNEKKPGKGKKKGHNNPRNPHFNN